MGLPAPVGNTYAGAHNRKPRQWLTKELIAQLDEVDPKDSKGRKKLATLISKVIECALGGDSVLMKLIWDRLEGSVPQVLYTEVTHRYDLSRLSPEKLRTLAELLKEAALEPGTVMIDITPNTEDNP